MDGEADHGKIMDYYIESSDKDFKTMLDLYSTGNNSWALFIGHLVIEKLLKALYLKRIREFPPLIHDLRRICEKSGIEPEENLNIALDSISRFNIRARYDDYKQNFSKLCTDSFTEEWIGKIKDIRQWIKTMLSE